MADNSRLLALPMELLQRTVGYLEERGPDNSPPDLQDARSCYV